MVLEPAKEEYLDLIAWEFLAFCSLRPSSSNILSFHINNLRLAHFEGHHLNAKQWTRKFFLIYGVGWEFTNSELGQWDFPIRASWSKVPDEKGLVAALESLSEWKWSCIEMVHAWAKDHEDALWIEALLTLANIDHFLMVPDCSKVKGHLFSTKAVVPPPPPKSSSATTTPKASRKCSRPTYIDTSPPAVKGGLWAQVVAPLPRLANLKVPCLLPDSCQHKRSLQALMMSRAWWAKHFLTWLWNLILTSLSKLLMWCLAPPLNSQFEDPVGESGKVNID